MIWLCAYAINGVDFFAMNIIVLGLAPFSKGEDKLKHCGVLPLMVASFPPRGQNNLYTVPWRQGFRHSTRNECYGMGWFAQIIFPPSEVGVNNDMLSPSPTKLFHLSG